MPTTFIVVAKSCFFHVNIVVIIEKVFFYASVLVVGNIKIEDNESYETKRQRTLSPMKT